MKSFKSAPLLVLSAWLIGSTSLYSPVYASCPNCGVSQGASKNNIFRNVQPRKTSSKSIFSNMNFRTIDSSKSSGPIFGTNDCNKNNNPIFGDNNCTRKTCGGAIFGPQTCKKIELPCEDCDTQPTKKAFIQNYKTIPANIYDTIHNCKDFAPIQLEWVDFRIQDENSESYSRKLGNYRFRLFGCRRNTKTAILNEGRIIQKNLRFIDIFEEAVDDCYKINKVPYDLCLNEQDYAAPEYILTAEITDYFMNLCDEYNWDKTTSEDKRTGSAEMTVTWRLMDLSKSKVLWKGETNGYSELQDGQYNGEIILIEQAFADAARENSDCPSGKEGGDLGWFGPGQMVPEFDKAAFEMKVDEISDIVETQFGFHILRKTGEKAGGEKSFADVKDDLKEALARNAKNAAFGNFIAQLRADAKVEFKEV